MSMTVKEAREVLAKDAISELERKTIELKADFLRNCPKGLKNLRAKVLDTIDVRIAAAIRHLEAHEFAEAGRETDAMFSDLRSHVRYDMLRHIAPFVAVAILGVVAAIIWYVRLS